MQLKLTESDSLLHVFVDQIADLIVFLLYLFLYIHKQGCLSTRPEGGGDALEAIIWTIRVTV